jgi:uncharacterized protein
MEDTDGPVGIAWQGGEPTLAGIPFFEEAVRLEEKYGRAGQRVSNAIQTNGILLNDRWMRFFKRYNFLVGLSLDGPAQYHDRYRRDSRGASTYHLVHPKIELLRKYNVAFNLLIVINDVTVDHPRELYEFCIENGIAYVQFVPAVERDERGNIAPFSMPAGKYGDFLCTLFDLWYNNGTPRLSIRLFDAVTEHVINGECGICFFRDSCDTYFVVEANGDVYPCDFFVESRWKIGNLMEYPLRTLQQAPLRREFAANKMVTDATCRCCEWNSLCHGGCPKYRSMSAGNYMCEGYRQFFAHAMPSVRRHATSLMDRFGIARQRKSTGTCRDAVVSDTPQN